MIRNPADRRWDSGGYLPQTYVYSHEQHYLLACPHCGAELDRHAAQWHPLAPERAAARRFSYRISQLLIAEIDLAQIVAAWQLALRDPAHMTVFCTDRLALPKSTTQALTPHHLETARADYTLGVSISASVGKVAAASGVPVPAAEANRSDRRWDSDGYLAKTPFSVPSSFSLLTSNFVTAGLDLGDQCWFVAREISGEHVQLVWIEAIAAERVRARVPELCRLFDVRALCVDAGPLRDLSRDLAFILNDLRDDALPSSDDPAAIISFSREGHTIAPAGAPLRWHGPSQSWQQLRCATVEFTQREGQGLRHKLGRTQDNRLYPLLAAHRDETIAAVVQELLPSDLHHPRITEQADGTVLALPTPRFLLPRPTEETRPLLDLYERHLLTGSRQERIGKTLRFLDQCENHFLLATAYAALAERLVPSGSTAPSRHVPAIRPYSRARAERSISL